MKQTKTFECLRCEHLFEVDYDPKQDVERACPKCASNSVRPRSKAKAGQAAEGAPTQKR